MPLKGAINVLLHISDKHFVTHNIGIYMENKMRFYIKKLTTAQKRRRQTLYSFSDWFHAHFVNQK